MTTLVMSMSGTVHRDGCYALGRAYKVVAPEIDTTEARAFIRTRKLDPCGSCFPGLRAELIQNSAHTSGLVSRTDSENEDGAAGQAAVARSGKERTR